MATLKHLKSGLRRLLNGKISSGTGAVDQDQQTRQRTMEEMLEGLHRHRLLVETIVDIGASDGRWSRTAREYFPNANYLLIEAQACHSASLKKFIVEHPNSRVVLAAAGAHQGEISFDGSDPFGGQASAELTAGAASVPMTSVDHEILTSGFGGPYLLKLDTHGYEVPILQGAEQTLQSASSVIIECYNFRISRECLVFHEMCEFMHRHDFRCLDIADIMYRELDGAFWQLDALFVRQDNAAFCSNRFK